MDKEGLCGRCGIVGFGPTEAALEQAISRVVWKVDVYVCVQATWFQFQGVVL